MNPQTLKNVNARPHGITMLFFTIIYDFFDSEIENMLKIMIIDFNWVSRGNPGIPTPQEPRRTPKTVTNHSLRAIIVKTTQGYHRDLRCRFLGV